MHADESLNPALVDKRVLLVGIGGLGCPAALTLVSAGVGSLVLCDDDVVDESNLHRQIVFVDDDIGRSKADAATQRLTEHARRRGSPTAVEAPAVRFLPENARELLRGVDVVVEGADNYATKFLAADACRLAGVPVVHSAALRWDATVWAVAPNGAPCYRCLFEDLPSGEQASCASAGVMGPVVGLAGALAADHTISILLSSGRFGAIDTIDGYRDALRTVLVPPRQNCALCSPNQSIFDISRARYRVDASAA